MEILPNSALRHALCDSWMHTGRDSMAVKQHGQPKSIEVTALFRPPFWKIWGKQNCNSSLQRLHALNLDILYSKNIPHFFWLVYFKSVVIFLPAQPSLSRMWPSAVVGIGGHRMCHDYVNSTRTYEAYLTYKT